MYITTFYSFKGGVGRTMALVNVAVNLAQRGRKVLVVDFDLEAPGLDTFPVVSPEPPTPGLVDYVLRYLDTGRAPDIQGFVGTSASIDNLLVMPSGTAGTAYPSSFGKIDWGALYARHDGYLLFEDLKEQWREALAPDYVLIDSRTGYTDTAGICTRQLPNAVTVLFYPNEQNLRGLSRIVADVRAEAEPPSEKNIRLHFVMSNVPDLDDEDDILIGMKERFQRDLEFSEEPRVVHRYDSLSLLNQAVFAKDRPKSRLAREYDEVANMIARSNLADRDGALYFIRQSQNGLERLHFREREPTSTLSQAIEQIEKSHASDGEVLFHLGSLAAQRGLRQAESLLSRAIDGGYRRAEAFLERAQVRADGGDREGAGDDANTVLGFGDLPARIVMQATRLIVPGSVGRIERSPAVAGLDAEEQITLADTLSRVGEFESSTAILERVVQNEEQEKEQREQAGRELAMNYIESGQFGLAMDLLRPPDRAIEDMNIRDAFNYGMAVWGRTHEVPGAPFERVVALAEGTPEEDDGPNYLQCLALAWWGVGDAKRAIEFARAAQAIAQSERSIFTCWRYHTVRTGDFLDDMKEITALIEGDESRLPRFMGSTEREGAASDQ